MKSKKILEIIDKALGRWIRPCLYGLSPVLLAKYRYRLLRGERLDLDHPKSFDEKMLWLNVFWRHPLKTQCADKFAVRAYVADQGYGHILPRLLGVYARSRDIDFKALPQKFVLKCTHGCKFNIICEDKRALNELEARRRLDTWMKKRISRFWGEVHYDNIKPRIICEEFLEDFTGSLPLDYKVYCFDGKAHCTMVCVGRDFSGHQAKYAFYNLDWNAGLIYYKSTSMTDKSFPKPEGYEEMIAAAEKLSRPFPFVRMDFYNINGKAVFGEMTFTPDGCIEMDLNEEGERVLGELIELPKRKISAKRR